MLTATRIVKASLVAVLCAAAFPVAASAATRADLVFGPIKDHGYQVEGVVTPTTTKTYSLGFVFSRQVKSQAQTYTFDYQPSVKLSPTKSLGATTFKTSLGAAGSVSIRFNPTGALKNVPFTGGSEVLGCKFGKVPARAGTAVGSFTFNTGTAFGTIHGHNVKARMVKLSAAKVKCKKQSIYQLELNGADTLQNNFMLAYHSGSDTGVSASYLNIPSQAGGFALAGSIDQLKPSSLFSYKTNLSAAHLAVAGAFMSGSVKFTRTSTCTAGFAFGSIAGTIKAHFFLGGTQTYPSKTADPLGPTPPGGSPNPFGTLSKNYPNCTA
jgi:hypothetical protein